LINKVVIGTWPLSGDYAKVDLETVQRTLDHCYDAGFKTFDTAPSYGNGFIEFCLGKVLGHKDDAVINTKVGNAPFTGKCFDVSEMKESFEQSLSRLSRDSVNILFLHNPRNDVRDYEGVLGFFEALKREGRIKRTGISLAKNYEYSKDILSEFDVVQDDGNLLSMRFLRLNLPENTQFMARSPLASGLLSGKIGRDSVFPSDDHRSGWLKGGKLNSIMKMVDMIRKTDDHDISELAKRFVLSSDKIDKAIFGVKLPEHVDDIVKDVRAPVLDKEVEEKLIALYNNDFGLIGDEFLPY